jgi:hypothetical protein
MSKQTVRLFGALLALVGSLILAFAAFSFVQQRRNEQVLESQVPGQIANAGPTTTPIVMAPASSPPAVGQLTLVAPLPNTTGISPTVTPFPTRDLPLSVAATVTGVPTAISLAPPTLPPASTPAPTINFAPTIETTSSNFSGTPRGTGASAARLVIPKLEMDLAVMPADYVTFQQNGQVISDWNVPFDAAGHLVTTAQPGEIGNAVISGHHNLTAPNTFGLGVFAGLWNLTAGDEVRVAMQDGRIQLWRVKDSFPIKEGGEPLSVRIQHAQQIMGDTPAPMLTLLTCWNGKDNPLSGNTYRWVVHAELVNVN